MLNMGSLESKKAAYGIIVISLVCTAGFVCGIIRKKANTQVISSDKEVNYVFFSTDGKSVTLSQQDVFVIKQMHEDGVLPTVNGNKFDMDAVMVCRIINSFNPNNKQRYEQNKH